MAPNKRQAITWTNAGPVHWRIFATLCGDELRANVVLKLPRKCIQYFSYISWLESYGNSFWYNTSKYGFILKMEHITLLKVLIRFHPTIIYKSMTTLFNVQKFVYAPEICFYSVQTKFVDNSFEPWCFMGSATCNFTDKSTIGLRQQRLENH